MSSFHYRSAVMSAARNIGLLLRPGVLNSWFVVLKDGDFFIRGDKVVRCDGVARSLLSGANVVKYTEIDGSASGSLFATEHDRVEKLDLIGYSDVVRFLNGTQPQFIRDVAQHYVEYASAAPLTPAQRERNRRAAETPRQAEERRRKNCDNMRLKRAKNKG